MSGVRGNYCILREVVTTQTFSFAQWVENFTVGGSENGRPRKWKARVRQEETFRKNSTKITKKRSPLELGSSIAAVNRASMLNCVIDVPMKVNCIACCRRRSAMGDCLPPLVCQTGLEIRSIVSSRKFTLSRIRQSFRFDLTFMKLHE